MPCALIAQRDGGHQGESMASLGYVFLYVDNPLVSAAFYATVLGAEPVETNPDFVLFEQDGGACLGLWARECVQPEATIAGGGAELVLVLNDEAAVEACHADLRRHGLCIIQPPQTMTYGYSFVLLDPDGHRVRLFTPA